MDFSNTLIQWYLQNKRNLPWRNTKDPYPVWISEIILQQTRVAQGMSYFYSFINTFPTVFDLARASEEQILKLWQGLGYYSRARNLHKTAQYIAWDLNGIFPSNYSDLCSLKGVGNYTAAAIASFCYNEVVPVVDGNVFRVLARYFDIETNISSNFAKKQFTALATELIHKENPALFNQGIMEFGALQCVPKNPNCSNCVFNLNCVALKKNKVNILPINLKNQSIKKRYFNYLVVDDQYNNTLIRKRTEKDIWNNLYEFPLIETTKEVNIEFIFEKSKTEFFINNSILNINSYFEKSIVHKLSHQHLYIKFWKINLTGKVKNGLNKLSLKNFPFPIVIFNFIETNLVTP